MPVQAAASRPKTLVKQGRSAQVVSTGSISGRVTHASDGSAPGDATVFVEDQNRTRPAVVSHTQSDGTYRVVGLPDGGYYVVVFAVGFATPVPGYTTTLVLNGADTSGIDFSLVPSATITGTVRDSAGRPVSGALVYAVDTALDKVAANFDTSFGQFVLNLDRARVAAQIADFTQATPGTSFTAANGTFTIEGLVGSSYTVRVSKPGMSPPSDHFVTVADGASVTQDLSFPNGFSIRGRFLDYFGRPIAGSGISLSSDSFEPEDPNRVGGFPDPMTATTDAAGDYTITGLPAGRYSVDQRGPGTPDFSYKWVEIGPMHPYATADFAQKGAGRVYGTITDDLGNPVPNLDFQINSMYDFINVRTDSLGRYSATGLAFGEYSTFDLGGWNYLSPDADQNYTDPTVRIRAFRPTRRLDLTLKRAAFIAGVVRDPQGNPVAGAEVFAVTTDGHQMGGDETTGPDGSFYMQGVPPGDYKVTVEMEHFAQSQTVVVSLPGFGSEANRELVLRPLLAATVPSAPCIQVGAQHEAIIVRDCGYRSDGGNPVTGEFITLSPGKHTCVTAYVDDCGFFGLKDDTKYVVHAHLTNEVGAGPVSQYGIRTLPTSGPTDVLTRATKPGAAALTFKAPQTTATIVGYSLHVLVKGHWKVLITTKTNKATVSVSGLKPRTTYSAFIRPVMKVGASCNSEVFTFKTG
jgi:hypothetical protein